MKKILCLIDSLGPGGAQRQMVGLASFLKEKGYEVVVAYYHEDQFYVDKLQSDEVHCVYIEGATRPASRMWRVARYIHQLAPDVVISYLETPSICACMSHIFNHKFKLIVSERNTTQHTGRNEKIRFNLFWIADYVVPNSFSQATYLKTNFPKLTDKVVTIPNFVDLEHFIPPQERSRRAIPEVVVAASIWTSKNTLRFIDVVEKLKNKGYQFHVSWYGKSEANIDYYNKCQAKIARYGIEKYISLKEKTSKIKECYQTADYFCLPSFYEGTPNVICEALASGLPVVCSDVCDNSRYVSQGKNGFLFNPRKVDEIVSAFESLFNLTNEEYASFCQYSRETAEQKLSKNTFLQSYVKLIES